MDVETNLNLSLGDIISLQKKTGKGSQKTTKSPQVSCVYTHGSGSFNCRSKVEVLVPLFLPLLTFACFTACVLIGETDPSCIKQEECSQTVERYPCKQAGWQGSWTAFRTGAEWQEGRSGAIGSKEDSWKHQQKVCHAAVPVYHEIKSK